MGSMCAICAVSRAMNRHSLAIHTGCARGPALFVGLVVFGRVARGQWAPCAGPWWAFLLGWVRRSIQLARKTSATLRPHHGMQRWLETAPRGPQCGSFVLPLAVNTARTLLTAQRALSSRQARCGSGLSSLMLVPCRAVPCRHAACGLAFISSRAANTGWRSRAA